MICSLYIHIPFCASFCDYCDFYSVGAEGGSAVDRRLDAYVDAVLADIKHQFEFFDVKEISTAYIGGGTPSVLGARRIRRLLGGLNSLPGFSPCEFTIEANPESAAEDFLTACRESGVNRISLGVQSFHEPSRRLVNRAGGAGILEERLALVSRIFPGAFSADLITGLPLQTEGVVLNDIEKLLAFNPAHVSLYSLTVEGETPLGRKIKTRTLSLPDRDEADVQWIAGRDALENAGYEQYEVSNFAFPGKQCRHNTAYWQMKSWLGAGPAASGTVVDEKSAAAKRFTFPADVDAYLKEPSLRSADCEELDRAALMRESLLMGFRYCNGPDPQLFRQRFGCTIEDCIPQTTARWRERGFFNGNNPTQSLMLFLNSFLSEAFLELKI